MTADQLNAIYQGSLPVGHVEGLEAVYMHGYLSGAGLSVTPQNMGQSIVHTQPAPTLLVKILHTNLR